MFGHVLLDLLYDVFWYGTIQFNPTNFHANFERGYGVESMICDTGCHPSQHLPQHWDKDQTRKQRIQPEMFPACDVFVRIEEPATTGYYGSNYF